MSRSREALERKAQIYENLKKRMRTEDDEDENEEDEPLIDFDRKYWEEVMPFRAQLSIVFCGVKLHISVARAQGKARRSEKEQDEG